MPDTRRQFLKHTSAVIAAPSILRGPAWLRADDTLRLALVGCGGRGTGAALQALNTGNVRLVAAADAFEDRLTTSLDELAKHAADKMDVPAERRFVGFDAFQKAIDCDVDVVVLATPPGFRPLHFEYAVEKGRHVFMEKPVAVDAPGVRRVLAAAAAAKEKKLKVGVGLQRHHEAKYLETVRRLRAGDIGEILLLRAYWNSAGVWTRPREEGMGEVEYQMRNWYYFNWLCGDHIVEQHIHNIDVCNWIRGGHPVSAQGQGGRQVRTGPDSGEIYDHHMVEFTYADGSTMLSQCRHIPDCWTSVSEHAHGSGGTADVSRGEIVTSDGTKWKFSGENPNPYQVEHDVLFDAIRTDREHNEAETGAIATMTAILGRMATYSGQVIQWDEALASGLALAHHDVMTWESKAPVEPLHSGGYPIPTPGRTRVL